jgi:hypothetical protein
LTPDLPAFEYLCLAMDAAQKHARAFADEYGDFQNRMRNSSVRLMEDHVALRTLQQRMEDREMDVVALQRAMMLQAMRPRHVGVLKLYGLDNNPGEWNQALRTLNRARHAAGHPATPELAATLSAFAPPGMEPAREWHLVARMMLVTRAEYVNRLKRRIPDSSGLSR